MMTRSRRNAMLLCLRSLSYLNVFQNRFYNNNSNNKSNNTIIITIIIVIQLRTLGGFYGRSCHDP